MTPRQCKAARVLLNWSQQDLADRSGVSVSTIRNFEGGKRDTYPINVAALQRALEDGGVEFLPGGCRVTERGD